ncbi:MAG: maleylacetoacetate isomerase [Pseudobdellovibrio sp.]
METLKLYNYFRSSTSYRVRLALEFKDLRYEYLPIHLLNNGGEQNSEAYRKLNPVGGVPTLEHRGQFISQSVAIIEYLEETFKDTPSLYPQDSFKKAKVRQVCEIINSDMHPLQNLKVTAFLEKNLHLSPEQKQQWMEKWIQDGLMALEKTIAPYAGTYAFGTEVTAADLFIVPQIFSAKRFNIDVTPYSHLSRVNENLIKREDFKKAHPLNQPDTPADLKK